MTSAHHEEVGRRVGAAGAGDSNNSRGPGRSGGGPRGAPWHAPVSRRPGLSGPGVPLRNAAAASLGAAEAAPVDASPQKGPPTVAPECRARQPRLPTWKILGGKKRKTLG